VRLGELGFELVQLEWVEHHQSPLRWTEELGHGVRQSHHRHHQQRMPLMSELGLQAPLDERLDASEWMA
jgi:hypothetical protein